MKNEQKSIMFLGNSLTAGGDWTNEFLDFEVHNMGVPGDTISDIINRIHLIEKLKPDFLFVMMGINDLGEGRKVDEVFANWHYLIEFVKSTLPFTNLVVQSILPINPKLFYNPLLSENKIDELNEKLISLASNSAILFINLYENFIDEEKMLNAKYTDDGLHLNNLGYKIWYSEIRKFLSNYKNEAL